MATPLDTVTQRPLQEALAKFDAGTRLSFRQISLLAQHARATGDMGFYVTIFARIDPELRPHFEQNSHAAVFLRSSGKAAGNINVFRKLRYSSLRGPVTAFEKIYRSNGADLRRLQWVYRNLYGQLPCPMPEMLEIVHGKRLSVVLFAFERFRAISAEGLIETLRAMHRFSCAQPATAFDRIEPAMMRMPKLYQNMRAALIGQLHLAGVAEDDLAQVERSCMDAGSVFNHGDLHRFNVGQTGMIYDWDTACFAPAALDLGRGLAALTPLTDIAVLHGVIRSQFGYDPAQDRTEVARILFFYLVYATQKLRKEVDPRPDQIATLRAIFKDIRAAFAQG